jgi:hypothetical protein
VLEIETLKLQIVRLRQQTHNGRSWCERNQGRAPARVVSVQLFGSQDMGGDRIHSMRTPITVLRSGPERRPGESGSHALGPVPPQHQLRHRSIVEWLSSTNH